jgi:hypothetical protein
MQRTSSEKHAAHTHTTTPLGLLLDNNCNVMQVETVRNQ